MLSQVRAQSQSACGATGVHRFALHSGGSYPAVSTWHSVLLFLPSLSWPKSDLPNSPWPSGGQHCDEWDTNYQITTCRPGWGLRHCPPPRMEATSAPHRLGHAASPLLLLIQIRRLWKPGHPLHPGISQTFLERTEKYKEAVFKNFPIPSILSVSQHTSIQVFLPTLLSWKLSVHSIYSLCSLFSAQNYLLLWKFFTSLPNRRRVHCMNYCYSIFNYFPKSWLFTMLLIICNDE